MPGTSRRGQPARGVRLTAPVQVPSAGTTADNSTSDAPPASSAESAPKDRSLAVFITCTAVTIVWVLIVLFMKLPGIALTPLLVVVVIGIVGISLTRRNASGSTKQSTKKEAPASAPTTVHAPPTAPEGQTEERTRSMKHTRHASSDAVIPRRGLPVWKYRVLKLVRRPDIVPKLNQRDQREHDELVRVQQRDARRAFLEAEIRKIGKPRRMHVDGAQKVWETLRAAFAANNAKSASKTTILATIGSLDAMLTNGDILLLTMTTVPGDGAMRSGVPEKDTLTIGEVFKLLPDLKSGKLSSSDFRAMLAQNTYGLYVIAPDFEEDLDRSMNDFQELLWELKRHFLRIYMDTGNNLTSAEEAAVRNADQVIFPMFTGTLTTKYLLGRTMDRYATNHYLRARGVVENSIAFISGLGPGEKAEDYRKYAVYTFAHSGDESDSEQMITERRFKGRVMGVGLDSAISSHTFCRLELMAPETIVAFLELLYQLFLDAIAKQSTDFETLESIIQAERAQVRDVPSVEDLYDLRHGVPKDESDETSIEPQGTTNIRPITTGNPPTTHGSLALHAEGK